MYPIFIAHLPHEVKIRNTGYVLFQNLPVNLFCDRSNIDIAILKMMSINFFPYSNQTNKNIHFFWHQYFTSEMSLKFRIRYINMKFLLFVIISIANAVYVLLSLPEMSNLKTSTHHQTKVIRHCVAFQVIGIYCVKTEFYL